MAARTAAPASIDAYIAASPSAVRPVLKEIRRTIRAAAPGAEELISYRMPAFRRHGILVYFAAFKNHVGLFPPVSGDAKLEKALAPYAGPKGNLRFPLDRPIPHALIRRIVLLRVKQDLEPRRGAKGGGTTGSIDAFDAAQPAAEASVCRRLREEIERALPDAMSKVWHGSPVWFVGDTPVVGYDVPARGGVVLLFWNGQAFGDPALKPIGKFKAAQARFGGVSEIKVAPLRRWLKKAGTELWDVRSVRRRRARARKVRR